MYRSLSLASLLAVGVFIAEVDLHAQGNSNRPTRPSYDHGDVLHGKSRNGPLDGNGNGNGNAVANGNGINYNGGPIMSTVNLYYILYGNWSGLDPAGSAILQTWGRNIAPSPYFNINTTYGDSTGANVPNKVTFVGVRTDTGSLGTSLSDASIGTLTANAIKAGFAGAPVPAGTADPNGVYMVLTAPGVAETSGFLTSYCGWHWSGSYMNGTISEGNFYPGYTVAKFAFIGNPAGPSFGACAAQGISPNGDPGVDAMISVMTHELSEAVSDPQGNAWYASNGEENGDLCAWNFGATQTAANGSAYNVVLNGVPYLIQQMWLNANGGQCALSYAASADFSVSVSGSQTVSQGGVSSNYTATATGLSGFNGVISWTYAPPAGITVTPTSSLSGNTFTFTLTAASTLAAGTYTIPITGTSGALVHSTNATLVVSAPNFSVSVSGSQSVAPGGTSGNYTLNYTALNGFSGTVTWTFASVNGITVTPSTSPLTGNGASFKLTAASTLAPGTYSIPVTGTSGSLAHAVNATLVVTVPSFSLSITPGSQTVSRPSGNGTETVTYTVTIIPSGGFTSAVTLSASGGITGITPSITGTNPVPFGSSGTLSVAVTNNAKKGNRSLTVTGSAPGAANQTATATLNVH